MDDLTAIQTLLPDAVIADSKLTPAYFQTTNQAAVFQQSLQHETEKDYDS
jgi:hypothetical protein